MIKRLLHIVPDDKFIDYAIDLFDNTFVENRYIFLTNEAFCAFKFIKNTTRIECVNTKDVNRLWQDPNVDMFCFHSLDYNKYQYVLSIPQSKKILWLSWGYDLYGEIGICPPVLKIPCYKLLTKEFLQYKSLKTHIKEWLYFALHLESSIRKIYMLKQAERRAICLQKQVLQRVDYISTVLPIEYEMLRKKTKTRAQYFPFQYSSRKKTQNLPMSKNANFILVGNSASATNNHLDLLDILKNRGITNVIQMPISYGDKYYAEHLRQVAAQSKQKIITISDFMERTEYISLLSQCKALVLGCIRQQALGNVNIMLSQGGKVFLYKDSIDFQFLKREGCIVFSIEDDLTVENIETSLTIDEISINREILDRLFVFDNVLKRVNEFLCELN